MVTFLDTRDRQAWLAKAFTLLDLERSGTVSGIAFEFLVSEDPVIVEAIDKRSGALWPDLCATLAHVFTTNGREFIKAFFRRARASIDGWNTRFHRELNRVPEEDLWQEGHDLKRRWVARVISLVDAVGALCSEPEALAQAVMSPAGMMQTKSGTYQAVEMDILLLTTLVMCGCAQGDIEAAKEVVLDRHGYEGTREHAAYVFHPSSDWHKFMVDELIKPILER